MAVVASLPNPDKCAAAINASSNRGRTMKVGIRPTLMEL